MQTQIVPATTQETPRHDTRAPGPRHARRTPVRDFARHYAEMVVAMLLGMFALGFALRVALEPAGVAVSSWDYDAPALFLLEMALTMTLPMAAWMRLRGHRSGLVWEMSAAMIAPTAAVIALLAAGVETDAHVLMASSTA